MEELKLNLGCNTVSYDGFKNVDIRNIPGVDIVDDVSELSSIEDGTVDHIRAEAILEHFAPDRSIPVIQCWVRKLKLGGKIEIMVPDGELIIDRYKAGGKWLDVVHSIFGNVALMREWHGNDMEKYMHHTLFSRDYLIEMMKQCGLDRIRTHFGRHGDCFTAVAEKV